MCSVPVTDGSRQGLSLFVVPVIYTLMDDFEHRVKRLFGRLKPRRAASPK